MKKFEYRIERGYGLELSIETLNTIGSEGWGLSGVTIIKDNRYVNGIVFLYIFKRELNK